MTLTVPPVAMLWLAVILLANFLTFFFGHYAMKQNAGLLHRDLQDWEPYAFGLTFILAYTFIVYAMQKVIGYLDIDFLLFSLFAIVAVSGIGTLLPRRIYNYRKARRDDVTAVVCAELLASSHVIRQKNGLQVFGYSASTDSEIIARCKRMIDILSMPAVKLHLNDVYREHCIGYCNRIERMAQQRIASEYPQPQRKEAA